VKVKDMGFVDSTRNPKKSVPRPRSCDKEGAPA